ncbi:hypothetical protein CJP74_02950 [Psittacicella melopsittaci]|uniref:Octanoyltransferase n=1 Tax=Psittacicella melopsittaci TaxID=2028576 RepID=A0A3A1Y6P9_9GAMM|nr:lipoyl(octanoyl) transferase LipB [Psittacicella melopsittaci]RIY32960.1 hypothetical protein CJP74_02950 [Psittacicella melopsittaci]
MFNIKQFDEQNINHEANCLWKPQYQSFIGKYLLQDLENIDTTIANLIQINPSKASELNNFVGSKVVVNKYNNLVNWQDSFTAMVDFTQARTPTTLDQILLLEHEPVFTQGINGSPEHVLNNRFNIPVLQADRGGQVTYHGPRQQIIYLLIDFERKKHEFAAFDVKFYARNIVTAMENAVVNVLTHLGMSNVHAKPDAPGIYVNEKKISSLGLKVTRHGTYHGIAINLDMDLEPFHSINPCGYAGLEMCNVTDYVDVQALVKHGLISLDQVATITHEDLFNILQTVISEYFVSYIVNCFAYTKVYDGNNL